jgi:hypothetical protein
MRPTSLSNPPKHPSNGSGVRMGPKDRKQVIKIQIPRNVIIFSRVDLNTVLDVRLFCLAAYYLLILATRDAEMLL